MINNKHSKLKITLQCIVPLYIQWKYKSVNAKLPHALDKHKLGARRHPPDTSHYSIFNHLHCIINNVTALTSSQPPAAMSPFFLVYRAINEPCSSKPIDLGSSLEFRIDLNWAQAKPHHVSSFKFGSYSSPSSFELLMRLEYSHSWLFEVVVIVAASMTDCSRSTFLADFMGKGDGTMHWGHWWRWTLLPTSLPCNFLLENVLGN